jgi:hypothetical protein
VKSCAWKECQNDFEPKTHNQIYCSDECCRSATNYKIMQKYYANKARRNGQYKTCSQCHQDTLSRFTDDTVCSMCRSKSNADKIDRIKKRMGNVQWT